MEKLLKIILLLFGVVCNFLFGVSRFDSFVI